MIVSSLSIRRKAVWGSRRILAGALTVAASLWLTPGADAKEHHGQAQKYSGAPNQFAKNYKLDDELTNRAEHGSSQLTTQVIVELNPGAQVPAEFRKFVSGTQLDVINAQVLVLPNNLLKKLARYSEVFRIHYDRPASGSNYRTSVTVGATLVRQTRGYTGAGIGVAVIDSGIASWHDDLTVGASSRLYPYGNQRVAKFVDFVNKRTLPYDDNGHGTHVAGIVAGNGYDSYGEKAGIAPDASLVSLKVLDANGQGTISNIIAALGWVAANAQTYNIRVVNLSVGARVGESYWTDPLTLAARALVNKGIVVVAAAGNDGLDAKGQPQYGGIASPGNAPWVLTVGASSTNGTLTRADDTLARFSSAGPTNFDYLAKPDLVAPGVGTISLAAPGSQFYADKAAYLVKGSRPTWTLPYLSLSGTSMAAPVVSGSVALMLQANPNLTPNLVKAILQYTSQVYPGYNALQEGAGFLNTEGAVELARFFATARTGDQLRVQRTWSQQIIWGNHVLKHGFISPTANAWGTNIVWGTAKTLVDSGDNIVWGTECSLCDNIVWGTAFSDNIVWGTSLLDDNIVWGTAFLGDNIVWGTADSDNIVWGTDCGGGDCDNIVWGTSDSDNIVWGTAIAGDNIVWGTSDSDNIVWGTSADDNIVWGTSGEDLTVFPDEVGEPVPDPAIEFDALPVAGGL